MARTADGQLVFTSSAPPPYGTFAERIASPDAMRFPLPDGASPAAVAAGVNPGMASWLPLQARLAEAGALTTGQVRMSCYTAEYTGTLAPSSEIDELAWFCYADRSRVPPVDQLLFDDLNAAGQLH